MTNNGISTTEKGQESYSTFKPAHRSRQTFYQYDYRTEDGRLFSCVKPTLEKCRDARDNWLQS